MMRPPANDFGALRAGAWLARSGMALCAVILAALAAVGCSKKVTIDNHSAPRWVIQHHPHAKVALVFVHGIFGDTVGAWTAPDGTTFFKLIADDPTVGPFVDIYAFGFTADMFNGDSINIEQAANRLDGYLSHHGIVPEYPEVVFVGHSMGGLVILRELLTHQQMLERVPLIVLYSTPQTAAQVVDLAHKVADNPALARLLPASKDDRYLQGLLREWRVDGATRPHVTCAYAQRPTNGVLVVPSTSASNDLCDAPYAAIDADHISIVKPANSRDQAVTVLVDALNKYAVAIQFLAKLETPDFITEGDHSIFNFGNPTSNTSTATLVNSGFRKLRYAIGGIADPHALRITPDPRLTPRDIEGTRLTNGVITDRNKEQLQFSLLWGAGPANRYSFVLSSDVTGARTVLVKVDWATVAQERSSEATFIVNNLNTLLAAYERVALWKPAMRAATASGLVRVDEKTTPATEARSASPDDVIDSVRKSILLANGELPTATQWLMTADFLDAVNWSPLAVLALRKLELEAPAAVKTINAEAVAASVSQRSGEKRVFASRETTTSEKQSALPLAVREQILASADLADASAELVSRLQQVPWLRYYGLSLQGDLAWNRGRLREAQAAYQAAAQLLSTPSISYRLQQVNAEMSSAKGVHD
jgi:pimeloyl-ACP methyl ester carboxylesterase